MEFVFIALKIEIVLLLSCNKDIKVISLLVSLPDLKMKSG